MTATSTNAKVYRETESEVLDRRNYDETTGTLGANPFTTTAGLTTANVALTGHGFSQGSIFYTSGATALTDGTVINGTFPIVAVPDANDFTIDISSLGVTPTGGTGGGSSVAYVCDNLVPGVPRRWAIWDENIQFDGAFATQTNLRLLYYRQPTLLSNTNQTNFLTNRYPNLMRTACDAAAADFMKDDGEYQKCVQRLQMLIQRVQQADDLQYRGAEIYTETP
jgi:hypothetical protein